MTGGDRFPRSVYRVGDEPDPRFTLANERTFLAWMRTALALLAGGVALEALGLPLQPQLRLAASLALIGLALVLPVAAWAHWAATERALRQGAPLPHARAALPLAAGVVAVGGLVLLAVLLR